MLLIDHVVVLLKRRLLNTGNAESNSADVKALVDKYPLLKGLVEEFEDDAKLLHAVKQYSDLHQDDHAVANDPILRKIFDRIQEEPGKDTLSKRRGYWIAGIAACAALLIGLVWLPLSRQTKPTDPLEVAATFLPNKNGVTLSMSGGTSIELHSEGKGLVMADQLRYTDGTPVVVEDLATDTALTLHVPRGSEYFVTLSDGTKIWMNAESELTYPRVFDGKKRVVQLLGEAYFEVSKDKQTPFVVETPTEKVEVLGTHFNVNAYPSEQNSSVALIEGKVQVSVDGQPGTVLYPGQQSIVRGNRQEIEEVNVEECVAWKNGEFMFNKESLVSAMREIGRWYDLEIEVDPALHDINLWGSLPRNENFGQVLKLIQLTNKNVKAVITGRRVRLIN